MGAPTVSPFDPRECHPIVFGYSNHQEPLDQKIERLRRSNQYWQGISREIHRLQIQQRQLERRLQALEKTVRSRYALHLGPADKKKRFPTRNHSPETPKAMDLDKVDGLEEKN